jgi:uncharacterized protein YktA (UPF0223 family)
MDNEYKIDYDLFSVEEIIKIIGFFNMIEKIKSRKIDKHTLQENYIEYRRILNNIALEKKYDKMLYEKSRISIYKIMKDL